MSPDDSQLRKQLVEMLEGGHAHADFDSIMQGFPAELRGRSVSGVPYTAWQLLEHLRISQWDILEFSRSAKHISPEWPKGYWPSETSPRDEKAWEHSVQQFKRELKEMKELVEDEATDLYVRIPHGTGQTILREALVLADHNSYHLGQLVLLRRLLGAWKE
jgi:uncharacterized damage-inducible protein DinB